MDGISIIIVNYNSSDYTINCIQSILENEKYKTYEIIIVDNDSQEEEKNKLKFFKESHDMKNLRIIFSKSNLGFGEGNNLGVKFSKYNYILLLNTDTLVLNSILAFCIEKIKYDDKIGALGLQLINFDNTLQPSYGYFPNLNQEVFELMPYKFKKCLEYISKPLAITLNNNERDRSVDYVSGAFMFMKKDTYIKINGFDKSFFMYFEETDLCKRIKDMGLSIKIYNKKHISHKGGGSIGAYSEQKAKYFTEGKFRYLKKHNKNYKIILIISDLNCYFKMSIYKFLKCKNKVYEAKYNYWKKRLNKN